MDRTNRPGPRLSLFVVLAVLASWSQTAAAHPEHYSQSAYLSLDIDRVTLELDLSPGTKVAGQVVKVIDKNGDGRIDDAEGRAYASALLGDLSLQVDGEERALALIALRCPPPDHLATGEDKVSLTFTATFPALDAGSHTLGFHNGHRPVQSVYLAHAFTQAKTIAVGKQTRDETYQLLSVDYRVDGVRRAPPGGAGGPWESVALGLSGAGALVVSLARARRRARA